MKKKQRPTLSQYTYIVNSILTACINRNGIITEMDIKQAVDTTVKVYDMLMDTIGQDDDNEDEPKDWLADYPWDGTPQRYTDIMNWLTNHGVTSKRRQSDLLHECIKNGFIKYDEISKKYAHTQP